MEACAKIPKLSQIPDIQKVAILASLENGSQTSLAFWMYILDIFILNDQFANWHMTISGSKVKRCTTLIVFWVFVV
jgi:hypothetical protein